MAVAFTVTLGLSLFVFLGSQTALTNVSGESRGVRR